ncbi:hypothetical protein OEZ85_003068 [Tetradesmus obliquus]|uniref:Tyrosinase copper-binding domain-containing protein n=1 Tax=Tetradesmus obliquus TaxID=3088 RepID=A0ABY8U3M5_TETOB|nr:hypothetical protein OEZ85_003068 [Tetradesmus obliquus]
MQLASTSEVDTQTKWGRKPRVRVRKELRGLTQREYRLLVNGLSTMLSVPTAEGQAMYGKQYKEYNYFIVKHAVSVNDPRGDQGHAGSCFQTFHRAWLLEFELALLAVVPELRALPYWDLTLDSSKGGRYYNTPNFMFSSRWAGSLDSSPAENFAVKDGIFGWRQIRRFNWEVYDEYAPIYNGSLATGLLRTPDSTLNSTFVTRFPVSNLFKKNISMTMGDTTVPIPDNFDWSYSAADYWKCTDAAAYRHWTAWSYCLDITTVPPELLKQYMPPGAAMLHPGIHWAVGSLSDEGHMGDMFDVATSPNEVLVFFSHHANIDRNNMIWQANLARRNPAAASRQAMYGYPASSSEYPYDNPGCYLNDVVNANFKFTDIFGPSAVKPSGFTHYDVLWGTRPGVSSPYTYDSMVRM